MSEHTLSKIFKIVYLALIFLIVYISKKDKFLNNPDFKNAILFLILCGIVYVLFFFKESKIKINPKRKTNLIKNKKNEKQKLLSKNLPSQFTDYLNASEDHRGHVRVLKEVEKISKQLSENGTINIRFSYYLGALITTMEVGMYGMMVMIFANYIETNTLIMLIVIPSIFVGIITCFFIKRPQLSLSQGGVLAIHKLFFQEPKTIDLNQCTLTFDEKINESVDRVGQVVRSFVISLTLKKDNKIIQEFSYTTNFDKLDYNKKLYENGINRGALFLYLIQKYAK